MSFDERYEYEAPNDYRSNPFTQDVSKSTDNKSFQQSPLLRADHEDPALHYIGETLPKPGETEATWAGRETSVGTSPIPARADHSHDTFLLFGVYAESTVGQTCAPGNSNLNQDHNAGENFLTSSSLFLLPQAGAWLINGTIEIARSGGGNFTGEAALKVFYLNGTYGRLVYRESWAALPSPGVISFSETVHYGPANIGVNATVELQYQHNDAVNHIVTVGQLTLTRLAVI